MMAIAKDFQSHGFAAPSIEHTKPPGIWSKLESLYDLEVLDERENHHLGILATPSDSEAGEEDEDEEDEEDEENPWRKRDFTLPNDELEQAAFDKRLDDDRESSPEAIDGLSRTRNLLGEDELREKREEYDKEDTSGVRGKGRKATAARAMRKRGGGARSTRSTPAVEDSEDAGEEEEGSMVDDSPESKGRRKAVPKGAANRRGRRR
jgi:MRG-binding protein